MFRQKAVLVISFAVATCLILNTNNFAQSGTNVPRDSNYYIGMQIVLIGQDQHRDTLSRNNDERVTLTVTVKNTDGEKIQQATVRVIQKGGPRKEHKTDKNGEASFTNILKGKVTVRVVADGYKIKTYEGEMDEAENTIEINPEKDSS